MMWKILLGVILVVLYLACTLMIARFMGTNTREDREQDS